MASKPTRWRLGVAARCYPDFTLIGLLLELVIGFEAVRLHVGIARLDMLGAE
jgi:hypothetical protein